MPLPPAIQDEPIQSTVMKSPSCASISSYVPDDIDSSNSSFSDTPSISNEKTSRTTPIEVLNKLREMGNEQDRTLFVDRLQKLWNEYHITCRKLPTISRQMIDLYRLYVLIREQNGFEQLSKLTKNHHWRDIVSKLNIPNCSTAAFNLKQKYINLKLFHYECKYDRGGIDPEPILAEIEKQKEKRWKNNDGKSTSTEKIDTQSSKPISAPLASTTNCHSQQVPALRPFSFPLNSVESTTISSQFKRKKLTAKDISLYHLHSFILLNIIFSF
jgi:AT-rich interactive domain-containing protein 1